MFIQVNHVQATLHRRLIHTYHHSYIATCFTTFQHKGCRQVSLVSIVSNFLLDGARHLVGLWIITALRDCVLIISSIQSHNRLHRDR